MDSHELLGGSSRLTNGHRLTTRQVNSSPLIAAHSKHKHKHKTCHRLTNYGATKGSLHCCSFSCCYLKAHRTRPRDSTAAKLVLASTRKPDLSFKIVFILLVYNILALVSLTISTSDYNNNHLVNSQHNSNKNSGQFHISQLCASKSQFPIIKRVEGAVLSSTADTDVNCTITLRTKSAQQHFIIRFEELRLDCNDHLKMFDGDIDYGQPSIKDFSCRDSLAKVPVIKTTGTFLTMRFSSDAKSNHGDGFRLVATAVFDIGRECPTDYALCYHKELCISKSLFCDDVNHCIDNSDEASCSLPGISGAASGSIFSGDLSISNALGLLIVLVLAICTCVIIFISAVYCRRENHYTQYQHHLQRTIGVPLQTSSSLMFANHQPQYHYFQPANLSPYITPQHHATLATLPRGYSTLPLNLARQQQQQQTQQIITTKGNNVANNSEYLMMAGLAGPTAAVIQSPPTIQTSLLLPTSQSILAPTGIRYSQASQDRV